MLLDGSNSIYRAIHKWVERRLGKPMVCWECGVEGRSRYHWANVSQQYLRDESDWKRLCVSCHKKLDFKYRPKIKVDACRQGHRLTPENTYFKKGRGVRECRICKAGYMKAFYERKRAMA